MSAEGRHCYKCGTYLEGSTCYYCQGVEDSKRDTEKIMNKPEPLKFEYEELRNKDNEVVAYRLFPQQIMSDYEQKTFYVFFGFRCKELSVIFDGLLTVKDFESFKQAVHEYNQKYCNVPEIDTSILDDFVAYMGKQGYSTRAIGRHAHDFKQTLKPQYFFEKESNNEQE